MQPQRAGWLFHASVIDIRRVSERMRRVTFKNRNLDRFPVVEPGQPVILYFGNNEEGRLFTLRHWRPRVAEFDVDFYVPDEGSGSGIAAQWLRSAIAGTPIGFQIPAPEFQRDEHCTLWLFGDETAIPAITAMIEHLGPGERATAILEVGDRSSIPALERDVRDRRLWFLRKNGPPNMQLVTYVENLILNPLTDQIWVGCESNAAARIQDYFEKAGFDAANLYVRGFWTGKPLRSGGFVPAQEVVTG